MTRICVAAAVAGAIGFGAPAASADYPGFTLKLTPQSDPIVGKPMIVKATGTMPIDQLPYPYWFSLDAIPTTVTTTCPPDAWMGVQFARGAGGALLVLNQRESPDAAGNFTVPVAVTPTSPGQLLLCGYTDDGLTHTMAYAPLLLNIQAGPATQPGPTRVSPPVEAKRGIRMCRALLSGSAAKNCIRRALRKANARCRRLPSAHGRSACLRAVRRVGRNA
jgi:hypothetical protein